MSTMTRPARPAARSLPLVVPVERPARAHLTRRGRLMLLVVLAGLLFLAFSLGRAATQASVEAGTSASPARVAQTIVMPGDTLWSVAKRIAPDNDPREVVAQIRKLNDLSTSRLQVGQQLLLPVAA